MSIAPIISLAILKVNWDMKKDYLDNFVPIIAECIRISDENVVSLPELQNSLQLNFKFTLPQNVIKIVLRKIKRQKYILLEDEVYKKNHDKLNELKYYETQQAIMKNHNLLIDSLVEYLYNIFKIKWSFNKAEDVISSYLEDNSLILRGKELDSNIMAHTQDMSKREKYLIASFIQHIYEHNGNNLKYLETIVQGNMLVNAIYLPNPTTISNVKFKEFQVYFDTTFLINALGYAGIPRREPCVELLQLLQDTDATLGCFFHTFDEIKGILDACAHKIESGYIKYSYGTTMEYFITKGVTASDIRLLSTKLESDLNKLGIKLKDKPEYIHEYVTDEDGLTNMLDSVIQYHNPLALARDVDSISSILRIRKDKEYYRVEDCKAIFVTTNSLLFKASSYFYYHTRKSSKNSIAPCITDYTFTNLLWLKKPMEAPDLPRKRIIADCYAATQPDEKLMNRYFKEIDKLEKNHEISAEDVYLLRYELSSKCALMQLTLGEEDGFTEGTVKEIIDMVHDKIKYNMEVKVKEFEDKENMRESKYKLIAHKISIYTVRPLALIVFLLLLLGSIYTLPWNFPPLKERYINYIISMAQLLLLIISISNIIFGATIRNIVKKIEQKFEEKIISSLRKTMEG